MKNETNAITHNISQIEKNRQNNGKKIIKMRIILIEH